MSGVNWGFYATDDDLYQLYAWLDSLPGMRFVEIYSRPDKPNRSFDMFPATDWRSEGAKLSLGFWPAATGAAPRPHRMWFYLSAMIEQRAFGRSILKGPTLMSIRRAALTAPPYIGPCKLWYWTETMARKYGNFPQNQLDGTDWKAMEKTVAGIRKHIRATATSTWRSMPVLPGIAETLKESSSQLWYW